jgi:small subunit ribosomal protein S18
MSDETTRPQQAGGGEERAGRQFNSRDKDKDMAQGVGEQRYRAKRRRKVSILTVNKIETVDYKDIAILRRFINDRGKMLPSRQTGNTAKQQRMVAHAIRRARELALLPFVVTEMSTERREYGPRRDRDRDRDRDRAPQQAPVAAEASVETPAESTEAE